MPNPLSQELRLQGLVKQELELKRRRRLEFHPEVEARYEQDEGPSRRRWLVRGGVVGLMIWNLFVFNDWFMRNDQFGAVLSWRLLMTAYGACILTAIWRNWVSPRAREWILAGALPMVMLCACVILRLTSNEMRMYDPFVFSLAFLVINISLPLRFRQALWMSGITLPLTALSVGTDERLPEQARIFAIGLMAGTTLFTLQACYRIERSSRYSYLLRLRETLAFRAAERRADGFARLSQTDPLTGLPNRRAFDLAMPSRWQEAALTRRWLALVLIDVDNFKQYNDLYGHPAGDACLKRVGEAMREHLPPQAFLGRIGGEEFAVLVQADSAAQCQRVAEGLRQAVEAMALPHGATERGVVTISLGLALRSPSVDGRADSFMASADAALYDAKHRGRNRCAQASNYGDLEAPAAARAGS
ncbi:GGDEF domain-containing protein [Aquincola tertiaricarbonis]|uniref:diguanylate cyclase n=1 Tax=Aquincola tertiaricarbonis TaxID=391953 RepID=A0ABY4S595_AQUTE|nr:GGDEF domain-containing protein [Aquincola tertiaricarbonis]URI07187.1 GGDEF domain-containing protein [Aquincola tertiaricarbonis]